MTDQPGDEVLLARLGDLLRGAEEPPRAVADLARLSFGLRDVDGELADLVADSALEATPAGVRASAGSPRLLSFTAVDADIDVQVVQSASGYDLVGQVAPAGPAAVRLEADRTGQDPVEATADDLGRFAVAVPTAGPWRL
ncbi:MAG TPA: hypothetical protein VE781_14045, partial [Kineosporiaceae bacterium]|nr:hypothetical protein [Kineosporiaceae bacterium]